jgi:hypothetical protein
MYIPSRLALGSAVALATLIICVLGIRSELDRAEQSHPHLDPPVESYNARREPPRPHP